MAMRLQELHPSLVHFPIALLPTSLVADTLGRLTGSDALLEVGRRTMPVAAASGLVAGLAGLIAQQAVKLDEHTTRQLITHRNINLGVIGMTALLAAKRSRRRKPSLGYLLAGFAGVAATSYSAYLGGHMVYEHGVGVKAADGVDVDRAPELTPANAADAAQLSLDLLQEGAGLTAREFQEGKLLPWLTQEESGSAAASAPQPA